MSDASLAAPPPPGKQVERGRIQAHLKSKNFWKISPGARLRLGRCTEPGGSMPGGRVVARPDDHPRTSSMTLPTLSLLVHNLIALGIAIVALMLLSQLVVTA